MRTRAQEHLALAERLVSEAERKSKEVQSIYGGLCHSFPVMVRTCGLCQALAFSTAKATGKEATARVQAHTLLLKHVGEVIGCDGDSLSIFKKVREADTLDYMHQTRLVLTAWVYFKRFAVSILKVEDSRDAEENGDA
jgi:CRISPR-associated protein Cmr5